MGTDTNIVNLSVNLARPTASKAGFGIGMLAMPHTLFQDLYRTYLKSTYKTAWKSGSMIRKGLDSFFAQNPSAKTVAVGRISSDQHKVLVNDISTLATYDYASEFATYDAYTITNGTVGAGSSSLRFAGTVADAAKFSADEQFAYASDTTPAADGTYTVRGTASHGGGIVTVPVNETIAAATFDGTLTREVMGDPTHIVANEEFAATGGAFGAGTSTLTFLGDAADAAKFTLDYSFVYSGDATAAANTTYTASGVGTLLAGTVTVPINETIVAAGHDGTIRLNANIFTVVAGGIHTDVAGADDWDFPGDANDAAKFQVGEQITIAADTTTAANGVYTVRAVATHVGGVVTVPVTEGIDAAAGDDGTLAVALDEIDVAAYLTKAINDDAVIGAFITAAHTAGDPFYTIDPGSAGDFYEMRVGYQTSTSTFVETWSYLYIDWLFGIQALGDAARATAWKDGLDAIKVEDNTWYGIAIGSTLSLDQNAVAEWAATERKRPFFRSNDAHIKTQSVTADTTSIAALMFAAGYDVAVMYHSKATQTASTDEFIDMAWMGARFWIDPDVQSSTYFEVNLTGITGDNGDAMTSDHRENIEAKYANFYTSDGAQNVTYWGWCSDMAWIDLHIGADWLVSRIEEGILEVIHNNSQAGKKVPFTNVGIQMLADIYAEWTEKGIGTQFLFTDVSTYPERGFLLTKPDVSEVDDTDRDILRLCKDIELSVSTAGAIHRTEGTINISG